MAGGGLAAARTLASAPLSLVPPLQVPVDDGALPVGIDALLYASLTAAVEAGDGELTICAGSGAICRVFITQGRIAWVTNDAVKQRLSHTLTSTLGLGPAVLQQAFERCRRTGRNFAEELIDSGVASRGDVRAALLAHNAEHLRAIIHHDLTDIRFTPVIRAYKSDLLFTLEEIEERSQQKREEDRESSHHPMHRDHMERNVMTDINAALSDVMTLDGAIASAVVDWESGLTLGAKATNGFDIDLAASGNTRVVKAKMDVMKMLGIPGNIEDILITLDTQIHLIRPLAGSGSLFLYVAIDKNKGNLGLARHKVKNIEASLKV